MPMGPFRLNDLVGSDIGLHVGANFVEAFPERVYASQLIPLLNEAKRLGEKTGAGFYKVCALVWGGEVCCVCCVCCVFWGGRGCCVKC